MCLMSVRISSSKSMLQIVNSIVPPKRKKKRQITVWNLVAWWLYATFIKHISAFGQTIPLRICLSLKKLLNLNSLTMLIDNSMIKSVSKCWSMTWYGLGRTSSFLNTIQSLYWKKSWSTDTVLAQLPVGNLQRLSWGVEIGSFLGFGSDSRNSKRSNQNKC